MTQAQMTPALSAIETHALTIAAHSRLAVEGEPSEALAAYFELKAAVANGDGEMPMLNLEDSSHAGEDDDVLIGAMVSNIEYHAQVMIEFGNGLLKAAHAGLMEAAIDGSLDSDANAWHLPSFAETNLDKVAI